MKPNIAACKGGHDNVILPSITKSYFYNNLPFKAGSNQMRSKRHHFSRGNPFKLKANIT